MIIGSVHTDLMQYVITLPKGNEEPQILRTDTRIGGAGYEAARMFAGLNFPFHVISDPGISVYGDYAREEAEKLGIELCEGSDEIGGCTFTLIDKSGNEGILCLDGSEYHFSLAQVYDIDPDDYGAVIVYSEMLVSDGSEEIIDLLNEMEMPVYLVISERISEIRKDVLEALYGFEPVLIAKDSDVWALNEDTGTQLDEAARMIHKQTHAPVILLSKDGALYMDEKDSWMAPGTDRPHTDRYAAALAAARMAGIDLKNAMVFANESTQQRTEDEMKKRLAGMILHR